MSILSDAGRKHVQDIASRYGVSADAVEHLLLAVVAGHGTQAQFNHPDIGGMGQWSQGGMTMVGDMFNNALKAQVDGVCSELSALIQAGGMLRPTSSQSQSQSQGGSGVSLFVPGSGAGGAWWPEELGQPASTGAQNNMRYAYFPAERRLAIDVGGRVTVYDSKDHQIGGFSQQQSGDQSLTFTSQYGVVPVSSLEVVRPKSETAAAPSPRPEPPAPEAEPRREPEPPPAHVAAAPAPAPPPFEEPPAVERPRAAAGSDDDIFAKIERLAALHDKGILTDKEFEAKKADLLDRL